MVHIANYVADYFDDHDQFLLEADKDSILRRESSSLTFYLSLMGVMVMV